MEPKKRALTMKQENFCREYILCGNASEAYRRAFDVKSWKPESVWSKASNLLADVKVKKRVEELKRDLEGLTGITKAKMLETLQEIVDRSLSKVTRKVDGENIVFDYDSAGANSAVDKIMKAMGYYAPVKTELSGSLTLDQLTAKLKKDDLP